MAVCYAKYRGRTTRGFIRYVNAKIAEKRREESYRTYVTDMLLNLTRRFGLDISDRWHDVAYGDNQSPEDEAQQAINNFYSDFRGDDKK